MKYTDLFENRKTEFNDDMTQAIMDVLVLYKVSGTPKTNINNIIDELEKQDYSIDVEMLSEIIESLGFKINGEIVEFGSTEETGDDLTDGEEYDIVDDMAKDATDKRLK